jgi:hypothetical protein
MNKVGCYHIIRQQLTPPGDDEIVAIRNCYPEEVDQALIYYATMESYRRRDVDHIAINEKEGETKSVALIGQPAGTGNKYSPVSSMVRYVAKEKT